MKDKIDRALSPEDEQKIDQWAFSLGLAAEDLRHGLTLAAQPDPEETAAAWARDVAHGLKLFGGGMVFSPDYPKAFPGEDHYSTERIVAAAAGVAAITYAHLMRSFGVVVREIFTLQAGPDPLKRQSVNDELMIEELADRLGVSRQDLRDALSLAGGDSVEDFTRRHMLALNDFREALIANDVPDDLAPDFVRTFVGDDKPIDDERILDAVLGLAAYMYTSLVLSFGVVVRELFTIEAAAPRANEK